MPSPPVWTFVPHQPGRTVRDAKSDYFENDAVGDPGQGLVREAIQNALDARRHDLPADEPVRVRFRFVGGGASEAPRQADADDWLLADLRPHLDAKRNGLAPDRDFNRPARWLIVEDEGTVGLTGDTTLDRQPPEGRTEEHYYHFVWAEGQTNKGEGARGSHGVGKMVFSLASEARTTLLHTRRASDDRELIVGRCHLKFHEVGDAYCDNGFFGNRKGDFTHPLDSATSESAFEEIAGQVGFAPRDADRTGLSVAILWPSAEITAEAIEKVVYGEWFESILSRRLVVTIETEGGTETDDSEPVRRIDAAAFDRLLKTDRSDELLSGDLRAAVALAKHRHATEPVALKLTDATEAIAWNWHKAAEQGLMPDVKSLRQRYLDNEPVHVRVPVRVPAKRTGPDGERPLGHFDLVLQRLDGNEPRRPRRPWFLREGISISDVRQNVKKSSAYRAIVAIDGGPVAAMLRTAENPAHTDWLKPKLKAVYAHGCVSCLRFVQSAAESLHQTLVASDQPRDLLALASFFGVAGEGLGGRGQKPDPATGTGGRDTPTPTDIEPSPQPLTINPINGEEYGGVRIQSTPQTRAMVEPETPLTVRLEFAYDVVRGNPLRRHSLADFDLRQLRNRDRSMFRMTAKREQSPVALVKVEANTLRVRIEKPDSFDFALTGFDPLRDLFVRATVLSGLRPASDGTDGVNSPSNSSTSDPVDLLGGTDGGPSRTEDATPDDVGSETRWTPDRREPAVAALTAGSV